MLRHVLLPIIFFASVNAHAQPSAPPSDTVTPRSLVESLEGKGFPKRPTVRKLLPIGLEIVKYYEGWWPIAYDDPVKFCTIGYGHLIARASCSSLPPAQVPGRMTEQQGEALLEQDTQLARSAVMSLVTAQLSDKQFSALSSFVFNVGSGAFAKSTMLKFLNANEPVAAGREFRRWVSAQGKILNGLINRRACEAALFREEIDLAPSKRFDPGDCGALGVAPELSEVIDIDVGG